MTEKAIEYVVDNLKKHKVKISWLALVVIVMLTVFVTVKVIWCKDKMREHIETDIQQSKDIAEIKQQMLPKQAWKDIYKATCHKEFKE